MRAAVYAWVSSLTKSLKTSCRNSGRTSRLGGGTATEFVDRGVSGTKDRRSSLDALLADATRRRFDPLVCWRLDRLGRNLRHSSEGAGVRLMRQRCP